MESSVKVGGEQIGEISVDAAVQASVNESVKGSMASEVEGSPEANL